VINVTRQTDRHLTNRLNIFSASHPTDPGRESRAISDQTRRRPPNPTPTDRIMSSGESPAVASGSQTGNGNGNTRSSLKMQRRFYRLEGADNFYLDNGETAQMQNKWVFETAWEVCNKGD
jgi:hypothetical protein